MRKLLALSLLFISCTYKEYDAGDGAWSYLRTDFVQLHTTARGYADRAVTDSGDSLLFATPLHEDWLTVPDSQYRALLYYHNTSPVRPIQARRVLVVQDRPSAEHVAVLRDPLTLESAWYGGGYLNLSVLVKTGQSDETTSPQRLGLVTDSIAGDADGKTYYLSMVHDQNKQPQYYSTRLYLSHPWPKDCKQMHIRAAGYKGMQHLRVDKLP